MEICIDSIESARNAIEGGASRLEVCSSLSEGGLTPTPGLLRQIKTFSTIPLYAMLRIRSGGFSYNEDELTAMLYDLRVLKEHADGFVFGALTPDNHIDKDACERVLQLADPLPVTFHRAFDEVQDPFGSLEVLIDLGFKRVLTSGQMNSAEEGLDLIESLVGAAGERIIVMPGAGITKGNIHRIKSRSGACEFHASAKTQKNTGANRVRMGAGPDRVMVTSVDLVKEMVAILEQTH